MYLFLAIGLGFLLSFLLPDFALTTISGYEYILYTLLAIGLYGAVHGIDLQEFHKHKLLILRAVTIGVLLKSFLIGGMLWLIFQTPYAFLLGIIVAQIDPLSVTHLISSKSSKFSQSGRTILRAWSSFDDPMTVLLGLYIFLPLALATTALFHPQSYILQLGANLFFAGVIWFLSKLIQGQQKKEFMLLGFAFLIAIGFKLMLAIAVIGLFLRPHLSILSSVVHNAFLISAVILGLLLTVTTSTIFYGIILGVSAYVAQLIVTPLVAPKLSVADKLFLAFAQYNGITAIILALILSFYFPQTVSIVAIAVVVINTLYYIFNWVLEKKLL